MTPQRTEGAAAEVSALAPSELRAQAAAARDEAFGTRVTFSPKVFIPLTQLCRDGCQYCTFAQPPKRLAAPFLSPEQVLEIATAGATAGCHEALFTLGEAPETKWDVAREWLAERGHATTIDYLVEMCELVLTETGLLPHANAGAISEAELARLRTVSASQGMMIETLRADLPCHRGAPDKHPTRRLADARGRRPAADPVHDRDPRRHRREPGGPDRGAGGDRRQPRAPRPRAGGDRPELPPQARHRDARSPGVPAVRSSRRDRAGAADPAARHLRAGAAEPRRRPRAADRGRDRRLGWRLAGDRRPRQPRAPLAITPKAARCDRAVRACPGAATDGSAVARPRSPNAGSTSAFASRCSTGPTPRGWLAMTRGRSCRSGSPTSPTPATVPKCG